MNHNIRLIWIFVQTKHFMKEIFVFVCQINRLLNRIIEVFAIMTSLSVKFSELFCLIFSTLSV